MDNAQSEHSQVVPEPVTLHPPPPLLHPSPVLNPEPPYTNPDHLSLPPSVPPSSAAYSPFAIPHPKRFNAVNINKKFLQKNSSSVATSAVANSLAVAAKAGSPAPRPAPQPSTSHSKLVTAKLTSTAQLSTPATSGWSRPSSATPPVSTTPSTSSNAPPPQPPAPTPVLPQFPHAGKVIQPQPRNALASSSPLVKKDLSAKPAWGNARPLPVASDATPSSDFPTAAEVAQGRIMKPEDPKPEDSLPHSHLPSQEADAFRGVHLDPNAHHWDEMEDDDTFLPSVIEFGDGRQYNVASTTSQLPPASATTSPVGGATPLSPVDHVSTELVSKEERFADDFDRRWPRTRQSPIVLQRDLPSHSSQHMSASSATSQTGYSSTEGSRVLFNERSNRLEPYNSPHLPTRLGPNFGFSRRGEQSLSPVESRSGKDAPPRSPVHSAHFLQKSSEGAYDGSKQSSRSHGNDFISRRHADRDGGLHTLGVDHSQSKVRGRDTGGPCGSFGMNEKRHRRLSGASFASSTLDGQPGSSRSSDVPLSRRSQPRESPLQHLSILPTNGSSQAARVSELPTSPEMQPPGIAPILDIEDAHKTAMHISAERARQRRQLEEEEREKEKERARKKAAELEARMAEEEEREKEKERTRKKAVEHEARAMETQKATATEFIEQAIASAQGSNQLDADTQGYETPQLDANERPPSLRPDACLPRDTKTPIVNGSVSPLEQVDSWRSKTRPPPPPEPLPTLSSSVFHESSDGVTDDNLEVIDFSDLSKFICGEQSSLPSAAPSSYSPASSDRRSFPARPVASDFFDDASPLLVAKTITSPSSERHALPIVPEASILPTSEQIQFTQGVREHEYHRFSGPNSAHPFPRGYPSPTASHHRLSKGTTPFRQVTMSALDDVMSRIKGALDDMQVDAGRGASINEPADWRSGTTKSKARVLEHSTSAKALSKDAKWLPPALRQPQPDIVQEAFGTTCCEPPRSPRPITFVVRLPTTLRPIDALPKRQLHLLKNSPSYVRFDTLSWEPPVDGMSKRDLSLNEILFKRPFSGKGSKPRYRVQLPRTTRMMYSSAFPKVNLPSGFAKNNTAPGRSRAVDDLPTWRRGPSSTTEKATPTEEISLALDVTSCSPPPEPTALPSELPVTQVLSTKTESLPVRPRTQPKLPAGSAVGFYRDPGPSFKNSDSAVNFTVTSELEENLGVSMLLSLSTDDTSTTTLLSESKASDPIATDEINDDMHVPTPNLMTPGDGKDSMDRSLRTPASAPFTWTKSPLSFSSKDSPARPPDPEHLKAVWSQAADREPPLSAVNSLEGIADDLTALPFTIQEVKSEDGETPPPTSAAVASKISIHDVTRAFQQVPPSSHRAPPLSPPTANGPVTRLPTFNYPSPLQAPAAAMRPHFAAFSSPMLAHSPTPAVLYPPTAPSPIPHVPMSGHPQLYNQPMWVHMQTSQNSSAGRPVPSPYPTQMVAYPTPASVHPVYTPGLSPQNVPPTVSGSAPPRPRGVPMLSPVMHPAAPANVPMYNGSPVLMHPPAMVAPGPRPPYMNSGLPDRGQGRSDGMSAPPHVQQSHSQSHIPSQPMYSHVPFSRPSW